MTPDEYGKKRLQDQINWYNQKSQSNQSWFKRLRFAEIVAAAIIPLISGLLVNFPSFTTTGSIIVGTLGVIVSIIAGVLSLGRYQEHWIEYRTVCESLKKEKFLFETGAEPYNSHSAFNLLVQRVETLISKENTNWAQYMMKPETEKKDDKH